jgi:cytochrome P450
LRPEEHADNWDLRHEDFQDHDFLYDVYAIMRQNGPFAHTDTPFLSATPGGAWVATRYEECYKILQDWAHFSSNPTPEAAEQLAGDLVVTLDPPRQQKFRKVLNPYFSPARMKGHLGFGAGVHRCLGSNLARLEFHIGIERVLSRLPDFTLAPGAGAQFHGNSVTRGFRQIPVAFTAGERVTQPA